MNMNAVLMGDLLGSETALSAEHLHARFNAAIADANVRYGDDLLSPLTITLGDEFQGVLRDAPAGLAIMRHLRLGLLAEGIDCRFVLGQVLLRTPPNPERAWNMMGPGFGRARDRLDEKKAVTLYRFSVDPEAAQDTVEETVLDALGAGLSAIESGWTDRQRDDITAQIRGMSAMQLARQRGVSVHSIYKVRSAGHYDAYLAQWDAIATAFGAWTGAVP